MTDKAFLIILDGWGHGKIPSSSAIHEANTPFIDGLYNRYPNAELTTFGEPVGLPEGQMGNSEVGHLNIGAGRIVYQELARINNEIKTNNLQNNEILKSLISEAKNNNKAIHLMGLLSDGGVHSHINHLIALCDILEEQGLDQIFIHAFLDGRDTAPDSGVKYVKQLQENLTNKHATLSTLIGRYYAMDRDNRWERIKKAYDLLVKGQADLYSTDPLDAIENNYKSGITDEFMIPIAIGENQASVNHIKEGDIVICFNFRTDRPRQITEALTQKDLPNFDMTKLNIHYATMTRYDNAFSNVGVFFEKEDIKMTLGEVVSNSGLKQLRAAETEKYPHVTFFLSGGREKEFPLENRILVESPKVATYDLQPEMSAYELTNAVSLFIDKEAPDLIVTNFANADMVGHTGVFEAAKTAAEVLDSCMESLVPFAKAKGYNIVIIADHGNSDYMINDDGSPHTAHTLNPVPIILIGKKGKSITKVNNGKLADIAPTLLELMNVDIPSEMTGESLLKTN